MEENIKSIVLSEEKGEEERRQKIQEYWKNFTLLADTKQDILAKGDNSLTAKCLQVVLKTAIEFLDIHILQCCITLGIPVNSDQFHGETPLMMCIDKDEPKLVEKIVELGADVNLPTSKTDSPLHYCIEKNKINAARALIRVQTADLLTEVNSSVEIGKEKDLDIDRVGSDGLAPLHKAAKYHLKDMINLLVQNGADVNVKGENGCTPLHVAANCTSG